MSPNTIELIRRAQDATDYALSHRNASVAEYSRLLRRARIFHRLALACVKSDLRKMQRQLNPNT